MRRSDYQIPIPQRFNILHITPRLVEVLTCAKMLQHRRRPIRIREGTWRSARSNSARAATLNNREDTFVDSPGRLICSRRLTDANPAWEPYALKLVTTQETVCSRVKKTHFDGLSWIRQPDQLRQRFPMSWMWTMSTCSNVSRIGLTNPKAGRNR